MLIRKDEKAPVKCTWDFVRSQLHAVDKSSWQDTDLAGKVDVICDKTVDQVTTEEKALAYSCITKYAGQ